MTEHQYYETTEAIRAWIERIIEQLEDAGLREPHYG